MYIPDPGSLSDGGALSKPSKYDLTGIVHTLGNGH